MKKITVYFDDAHIADGMWFQRSPDCPLVAAGNKIAACVGGTFQKELDKHGCWTGDMKREPHPMLVCQYRDPTFGEGDHIRGCHHDERAVGGATAGDQVKFGNTTVRHATPEEEAAARAEKKES